MRKGFTLIELMIVIAIIAIIAAIAIPNLLESRVTANEAAAAGTLKAGVFPAMTQFQAGAYMDTDADNVGEHGHLVDIGGNRATTGAAVNTLKLLTGPLQNPVEGLAIGVASTFPVRTANGYNFAAYTPNADNTGFIAEDAVLPTITDNAAERTFIVAAGPDKRNDTGRRVFIISSDGQVRSPTAVARANTWYNATGQADAAGLLAGLQDALTGADTDLTLIDNANYPFYSK